jgi:NTE family protein
MFMREVSQGSFRGALLRMGNSAKEIDRKSGRQRAADYYDAFLTEEETALAFSHPTDLKAISQESFDRVARHGYEVADGVLSTYLPEQFPSSIPWRFDP